MENAYGALDLISSYAQVGKRVLRGDWLVWQHGWLPEANNEDIDLIVGESGETSALTNLTYFVARQDQMDSLKNSGVPNTFAVGLPFAYQLRHNGAPKKREVNSLLIMPGLHGIESKTRNGHVDSEFIAEMNRISSDFSTVRVLLNCDDFLRGRQEIWEANGYRVSLGGCEGESDSLSRLLIYFRSFQTVVTNGFGSHIAYAAASGCRVSIIDRQPTPSNEDYLRGPLYSNRPDLIEKERESLRRTMDDLRDLGLFVDPRKAPHREDWGKNAIGFYNTMSPSDLRELLLTRYRSHNTALSRVGLGPIEKKITALRRTIKRSGVTGSKGSRGRPFYVASNFFELADKSRKSLGQLRLVDSGNIVRFRRGSADLNRLTSLFLERELDALDLSSPSRILTVTDFTTYSSLYFFARFPMAEVAVLGTKFQDQKPYLSDLSENQRLRLVRNQRCEDKRGFSFHSNQIGAPTKKTFTPTNNSLTVENVPIRIFLNEIGWNMVDVIMLETDGSEYELLRSWASDISLICSVLIVEFHHRLARKKELDALIEQITSGARATVTEMGAFTVFDFR